jgi:hypothetical protein
MHQSMLKRTITLAILASLALAGSAQPLSIPRSPKSLPDSTSVGIHLDGSSFFYNYEYFKPFAEGYTQPGFSLMPTVQASFGSQLLVGGGVHLNKYWGTKPFTENTPIVFARYQPLTNFYVQVGTIESRDGHMLSDLLYNPLYKIDYRQENGLQLRYYGTRLFADAWVSWENYIRQGDNDQERLTAGGSILAQLTPSSSRWEVTIPLQLVFKHIGGQINDKSDTTKRVHTYSNLSLGIQVAYRYSKGTKVGLLIQPVKFGGSFNASTSLVTKGRSALSSTLFLSSNAVDLKLGCLFGNMVYTILGDPIYSSVNVGLAPVAKARNVFTGTFAYHKEVYPGMQFRFDTGCYLDPSYSGLDYFYGAGIIFQLDRMVKIGSRE